MNEGMKVRRADGVIYKIICNGASYVFSWIAPSTKTPGCCTMDIKLAQECLDFPLELCSNDKD
jgi:hypothetical protein